MENVFFIGVAMIFLLGLMYSLSGGVEEKEKILINFKKGGSYEIASSNHGESGILNGFYYCWDEDIKGKVYFNVNEILSIEITPVSKDTLA